MSELSPQTATAANGTATATGSGAAAASVPANGRAGARRSETLTGTVEVDFPQFRTPPAEPMGLLADWLAAATERGVREPRALALATADERGRPSSRILAVNQVTEHGIVFITHAGSQKGRELAANPHAS
ncbi:pyridoxamine 5'-phosphate oxidase family protein, partial [Streptomyces sp. NPDC050732]|uniref:pyridoxamine 5'-phosphate oxidase family protein n=1 Tax=Streptomyces sp. NPDC050732 TaxID=3154632 RepID=UPI00343BCB97